MSHIFCYLVRPKNPLGSPSEPRFQFCSVFAENCSFSFSLKTDPAPLPNSCLNTGYYMLHFLMYGIRKISIRTAEATFEVIQGNFGVTAAQLQPFEMVCQLSPKDYDLP